MGPFGVSAIHLPSTFLMDVPSPDAHRGRLAGGGIRDEVIDFTRVVCYGYADEACFEERVHSGAAKRSAWNDLLVFKLPGFYAALPDLRTKC